VAAGGEDANMGDADLTATPDTQGQGGHITIEAAIPFYGGCCYALYGYDVTAVLDVPKDVQIVSGPDPQIISKVEAKAGGVPSYARFKWIVKSMSAGTYEIGVNVDSQNCGSTSGSTSITVTEGCVLSIPEVYPEQSSTKKKTFVNVQASSPIEGVEIDSVTLYYVTSQNKLSSPKPKDDIIFYGGDGSKKGTPISMELAEDDSGQWETSIPKQNEDTYLHYWVVATDNSGNATTSPAYVLDIEDMEYADFILTLAIWLPIILAIISVAIITMLLSLSTKVDIKQRGLLILGSSRVAKAEAAKKVDEGYLRKVNLRVYAVAGISIVAGVGILLWAILGGQLSEIIYVMGGGL
jgi:hypothetical protein